MVTKDQWRPMAEYVSGTDFLHSFEEVFGDRNVFLRSRCGTGAARCCPSERGGGAVSESDGAAAAERERGRSRAECTSSRGVIDSLLRSEVEEMGTRAARYCPSSLLRGTTSSGSGPDLCYLTSQQAVYNTA